ncbi:MAG: rhomboid family intramembrane serine protease [Chitinispirillaceae bacterium]|nr:rhomboid family intramembrane serine protease [Chitinispirillaceae bacterium]
MFPLRDDNPTLHTSLATFTIIAVNVAAWIFIQGWGFNPGLIKSICAFGLIPGELLGTLEPGTRIPLGGGYAYIVEQSGNWYSIITSMFMHAGWLHLIGNMWFLAIFGDNVEDAMGSFKFILFYLLCGIAAEAAQVLSHPSSPLPMVGASGAIGGVMGAYAVLYPRAPVHLLVFFGFFFFRIVVPAFFMLGYWFLLQFLGGFASVGSASGGVAFWAHIGGFIAGILLLRTFCSPSRVRECRAKRGRTDRLVRRYVRR